jgi:glycerate kinase
MKDTLFLAGEFKGTLSAAAAAAAARRVLPGVDARLISDGGNGLLAVFAAATAQGKMKSVVVRDAYNKRIKTFYFSYNGGRNAVIESAKVCALAALPGGELRKLLFKTSSSGLGSAVKAAVKNGAKEIYTGLGGVGCNDGGAGMAQALGVKFFDGRGRALEVNTGNLREIKRVDLSALKKYKKIKFYAVADVENKLLGKRGSAAVFGPQKGAGAGEIKIIEAGLKNLSAVIKKETGKSFSGAKASGAAGATGFGMMAFLNARVVCGAEFIFKKTGLEARIRRAGRVVVTEGRLDRQTFMGKAPGLAVRLAKKYKKELIFICGTNELPPSVCRKAGISRVLAFAKSKKEIPAAMARPAQKLKEALTAISHLS